MRLGPRVSAFATILLAASLAGDAAADPAFLVKDLNPAVSWGGSSGHVGPVRWGSYLYFFSHLQSAETKLVRTDGTPAGTVAVATLPTGMTSLASLTAAATQLFFSAGDAEAGVELWRSDGTQAGTYRVKNICQTTCDSTPRYITPVGNGVVFQARTLGGGAEVWWSDGTDAGTHILKAIGGGTGSNACAFTRVGDLVYFIADDHVHGYSLWKTDGTWSGTVLVKAAVTDNPSDRHVGADLDGLLIFTAGEDSTGIELWRSDGTDAGTYLIKAGVDPVYLTRAGPQVFFAGYESVHGRELWKTDGTVAGTVLVKDLVPGATSGIPIELAPYGNRLLFQANGASGQLWISDGTTAGTTMVSPDPFQPFDIVQMGGNAYFGATTLGSSFPALWRTDGTAGGTYVVSSIVPAAGDQATPMALDAVIVLWAGDSVHGNEPWVSDGTAAGTTLLIDTTHTGQSGDPSDLVALNDRVLFSATETLAGTRWLWVSDGTDAGTVKLSVAAAGSSPQQLTAHGGQVFYSAMHQTLGRELFASDGTEAGTGLVVDSYPGIDWGDPTWLTDTPWGLLFTAYSSPSSRALYLTDGTAAGTRGFGPSVTSGARALLGDRLFFALTTTNEGNEPWTTAGEPPSMLRDLAPGIESSSPSGYTRMGDRIYFAANDGVNGSELWATDGTAAGTVLVKDINPGPGSSSPSALAAGDGILYFAANDGAHGSELWKTDGTTAGTQIVRDINTSGSTGSAPTGTVVVGRRAFFSADDWTHGREPWTSDGTSAGTIMLRDIETGSSSTPTSFTAFPSMGIVLFAATSTPLGKELWLSDGTPAGTTLVEDISPGGNSSTPDRFTRAGQLVFFAATDPDRGRELWAVPTKYLDRTGPLVAADVVGTPGDNGWYRSDVSISWTVTDPDSPLLSTTGCDPLVVTTDTAGLDVTCTGTSWGGTTVRTVTIARDATAPVPVCPAGVTLEATSATGATAVFTVTATDNLDPAPIVAAVPPSGDRFPLGTTHVTVTARDAAGNQGSCGFDLVVADTTPPVVTCPGDVTVAADGATGAVVTYSPATAVDAVDPVPLVEHDHASGSLFAVGTTTVTATARDAAGNAATCTFHVTVGPWTGQDDAGVDAEVPDAEPDTQPPDDGPPDAEVPDAEVPDAEVPDTRPPDAEVPDAEVPDAEPGDVGDAAPPDDGPGGTDAPPASDGPGAQDGSPGRHDAPDTGARSSGCGCSAAGPDTAGAGLLLGLALLLRRRRRRHPGGSRAG